MAALRVFNSALHPWLHYGYALAALAALLVPRAGRWGARLLRARLDERLLLVRAVGATTQAS